MSLDKVTTRITAITADNKLDLEEVESLLSEKTLDSVPNFDEYGAIKTLAERLKSDKLTASPEARQRLDGWLANTSPTLERAKAIAKDTMKGLFGGALAGAAGGALVGLRAGPGMALVAGLQGRNIGAIAGSVVGFFHGATRN